VPVAGRSAGGELPSYDDCSAPCGEVVIDCCGLSLAASRAAASAGTSNNRVSVAGSGASSRSGTGGELGAEIFVETVSASTPLCAGRLAGALFVPCVEALAGADGDCRGLSRRAEYPIAIACSIVRGGQATGAAHATRMPRGNYGSEP
jgi:hypothetical protein